jgi:hypothetical protein
MEKRCTRSTESIDRGVAAVHRSTVDRTAAHLTGAVHAAGFGRGGSPRGVLEEKGAEGLLTVVGGGRHRKGERPATRSNPGG